MGLLRRLGLSAGRERVGGDIASYGLVDWWLATFTPEERRRMTARYRPFGRPERNPLTQGPIMTSYHSDGSPRDETDFLTGLASWFNTPSDRYLAKRILAQAEALHAGSRALNFHFLYSQMIDIYYPDRETDPAALPTVIRACEQQIALAPEVIRAFRLDYERTNKRLTDFARRAGRKPDPPPPFQLPSHRGYKQLCIIREKEGNVEEAIRLARQALAQGWAGDWEQRLARYQRKIAKQARAGQ